MNVLVTTGRNIRHIFNDSTGTTEPEIEAVLTTYGKHIDFVGAGLTQVERCETIRFSMTIASAKALATQLTEWAKSAEEQSKLFEWQREKE